MTDLLSDVDAPSDAELISRVRGGDVAAYGELFSRHQAAANRLARQLVRGPDADDLVSEAFAKVLTVLQGGGGPDVAFRAYLLTAVRRLHVDRVRMGQRLQTTDDMTPFDPGVPFQDTAVAGFESGAAAKAFASLPERWQLVLWHLEVEGQKPADIAPLLGMSANSVSALAYRAREGLRQAFLTMHLSDISETDCRWVNEHLGAYVRKGLSKRDAAKVQGHLDECRRCTAMYLELTDVNSNLAGIIAPLLLGAAAAGYLASGGGIAAGGLAALLSRTRDFVGANTGAVAAAGVAVVAAVAATAVLTLGGSNSPSTTADAPTGSSTSVPSSAAPTAPVSPNPSKSTAAKKSPSASTSPSSTPATSKGSPSASASPSAGLPAALASLTAAPTQSAVPVGNGPGGGPTGGGPTGTPPPPPPGGPPTISSLSVDPDAGQLNLALDGITDPSTPIDIALQSSQTTFGQTMSPGCSRTDARHVRCLPGAADAAGRAAAVAALAAVGSGHFDAALPLEFPDDMTSDDLTVVVSIDGSDQSTSQTYTFRPTPRERLALAALQVLDHTVSSTGTDRYVVRAPVSGVKSGTVRLTLSGVAAFGDPVTGCTRESDTSLTCTGVPTGASDLDVPVLMSSDQDQDVTLRVGTGPGFYDPDSSDNARTITLSPTPEAAFAMTGLSPDPASSTDGSYQVSSTVTAPAGLHQVTFSAGDGATFAPTAGCTPNDDNTRITCDRGTGASYDQAFLLVATHADVDTAAAVSIVVPDDFVDLDHGDNTASGTLSAVPVVKHADVGLTLPASVPAEHDGTYRVTGTLTGIPSDYTGKVTYGVSNGASFDSDAPAGCALESGTLVCDPADHPVFHLVADDNSSPTDAMITVAPLPGYHEDDPSDNVATTTLETFVPDADLSLTLPGTVAPADDGGYTVDGTLAGVPSDYTGKVRFSLSGAAAFVAGDGCTVSLDGTLVCDAANGSVPFHLTATDNRSATPVTITVAALTGHTDDDTSNNAADTTLQTFVPDADLSLTAPDATAASDDGSYTVDGTLAGVPSDYTGKVRFSVGDGATFVAGNGCTLSSGDLVCDPSNGPVPFHLTATNNRSDTVVTITVAHLAGYTDKDTSDNSASTTLQTFVPDADLKLSLPSGGVKADDDGGYTFNGSLTGVPAGFDGKARFTVSDGAAFVAGNGCTVSAGDLVCDASNGAVPFHLTATNNHTNTHVTITVAALDGYTDKNTANNSADTTLRTFVPKADVSLTLPATAPASDDGDYRLDGTLAGVPSDYTGKVRFSVSDAAAFVAGNGCTVSLDGTLVCDASNGTVPFHLTATDNRSATPVTITVASLAGHTDPTPGNNSADTTLQTFVPDADLSLTLPGTVAPADDGSYTVDGTLAGVPSDYTGKVRFSVSTGARFVAGNGCTVSAGDLVCDPSNGPVPFHLTATNNHTDTVVTITVAHLAGYTDKDTSNNSADTTLQTFVPDADLKLSLPSGGVKADDDGGYTFNGSLTGVPAGFDGKARFTVSDGAAFVAGNGCTLSAGDLVCDASNGAVPFHLTATNNHTNTPVTITVAALDGYTDKNTTNNSDTTTLRTFVPKADLSLTLPGTAPASDDGDYRLDGTLAGVPDDFSGKARFSVSGGAAFVAGNGCTVSLDGTLVCDASNGTVPFHLTATDNRSDTPVTITVASLTGHTDPTPGNNSADTTLQTFVPDADLSLTLPGTVAPADDGSYTVDGTLSGVPGAYHGKTTFSVSGGAAFVAGNGCTVSSEGDLVCDAANGSTPFHLTATNNRSDTPVTITVAALTGHTDREAGNNSADTTLQTFTPDADLSLAVPGTVVASDDGSYSFNGTLAGVPSDYTGKATFSVSGAAALVAGNGCTLSAEHLVCDAHNGPVPFHLTATDNHTDTHVTITVAALDGYTDKTPANNDDSANLQAFTPNADLKLSLPGGGVNPDDDGGYTFNGTLTGVPSDYTGKARFSVSDKAAFVAGNGCTLSAGDLVCDAHNGSVPFHLTATDNHSPTSVTITVAALDGYTDRTLANNSDTTTLKAYVPPTDVKLDGLEGIAVHGSTNVVQAAVSGVPAGVSTLYVDLTGGSVGSAGNQVHFINGADGASGDHEVTCAVTSATRVTCQRLRSSFTINMDVQHPQGRQNLSVTMTVTAVGSGEPASNLANNSRDVTIP